MSVPGPLSERALILTPVGRDAELAQSLLAEAGRPAFVCGDLDHFQEQLRLGAGLAVIADDALGGPFGNVDLAVLAAWVAEQPTWSDFPFIVLTRRGGGLERNPVAGRLSKTLGNVSFVERPFHPTTFLSVVDTAVRARRRQYEARARIEELHESEAHYRHTVELNPQVTWTATRDGQLDHTAQRWFDWTGHAGTGATWTTSIHAEDLPSSARAWSRSLQTGEPYDIEHRVLMRDGAFRWARSRAFPRLDVDGHVVKWYGTTEDIHERKMAEQAMRAVEDDLRRLNENLEAEVAERTRDHEQAQDQLRQAQKMEVVGQLTGGIAHDFNNLLQGIVGSLDLVRKRISQGRVTELEHFVNSAMASAKKAAALTHRLLAFSRRQPLDPKPVEANRLVSSMADLLRRTMGERYEIRMALDERLWITRCDPNQLESALLNLAINARDAMPSGGKLIIETCNTALDPIRSEQGGEVASGDYVCVSVTDTGIGMSREVIDRAFEPFFTTKPMGQGTGLGLSMVYGFARQSEGYANIYSEVDKGSTIKLYLPRTRDAMPADARPHRMSELAPAGAGEAVLVVEDEPIVRGLIVELLADLGYQAIEAVDGLTGVQALRSDRRIDLLVTDIGLPGLNGREVAEAGRQARPGLKILFMTGYAENAAMAAGFLESGMAMITKPFAMETLAARMRDMIES